MSSLACFSHFYKLLITAPEREKKCKILLLIYNGSPTEKAPHTTHAGLHSICFHLLSYLDVFHPFSKSNQDHFVESTHIDKGLVGKAVPWVHLFPSNNSRHWAKMRKNSYVFQPVSLKKLELQLLSLLMKIETAHTLETELRPRIHKC